MVTRLHVQQLEIQLLEENVQDLVRIRTELATKMLESNLDFYRSELDELMAQNEDLLTTLNAIYKTPKGLGFNVNQTLDDATISANRQHDKNLLNLILSWMQSNLLLKLLFGGVSLRITLDHPELYSWLKIMIPPTIYLWWVSTASKQTQNTIQSQTSKDSVWLTLCDNSSKSRPR